MRRALALAVVVLGVLAPTASAATTLNVIPHGQWEPGVPWAASPGMLPAETQAQMYDRLTPLFRDVTDAQLVPSTDGTGYYKSAALVDENDPSLITNDTVAGTAPGVGAVSARIKRDAYGVPHIYSDTDAGVTFAAGYVEAADRSLLLDQARANGVAGLIDMPGVPAIQLVLGLYTYKPTKKVLDEATALQTKSIEAQGAPGPPAAERHRRLPRGHQPLVLAEQPDDARRSRAPTSTRSTRSSRSSWARAAARRSPTRSFLDAARSKLGADPRRRGLRGPARALRPRDGDARPTRSFPYQTNVSVAKPRGMVRIVNGSFRSTAPKLPASTRAAAARAATVDHPYGPPQLASNILIASGQGVADRLAALRRRPADRLQLPRPDAGDGPPRARTSTCAAPRRRRSRATCSSGAARTTRGR